MIKELQEVAVDHYQYVSNISSLEIVQDENVNIAIYERDLDNELNVFLKWLSEEGFKSLNTTFNIVEFETLFDDHFKEHPGRKFPAYQLLRNDIKQLVKQFSEISNASNMRVFFGIVNTNMCGRFHVDMYELRMLCTYYGLGTEWLPEDNVNFAALNENGGNEEIVLREEHIRRLNAKDVAIFKGALSPNCRVGGLVHKSPAIQKLKQKRILLRIDSNSLLDCI
ncbi:MAG: DUF1826 domain-containing protein [Flavobacteriales bacterium]|nr:DUF1826 domain-containing protein [Flavobacteriales bacterium]